MNNQLIMKRAKLSERLSIIVFCTVSLLAFTPAHGEIVKYVIDGRLDHMTDGDEYYQMDLYGLDGAYYTREMVVDTSVGPDRIFSGETTAWAESPGFLISNTWHITERPGNRPSLRITTSDLSQFISVQNAYWSGRYYDALALGSSQLAGDLKDLFASEEWIYFEGDFIPGESGYVVEPPYPFRDSDVSSLQADTWEYAPDGISDTIDGKYLQYKQELLSARASCVSCPTPNPEPSCTGPNLGILDTGWVRSEDDFQDRYDQLTADGCYPTTISGRRALVHEYRGIFTKVPSEGFTAYGFHGLGQARYEELLAWADAEGFLITSDQSFTDFWGEPRHQIVMVYSGKFLPTFKDGMVQLPLVWHWNGEEWRSFYAELTLMNGVSPLTLYLSEARRR